MNFQYSFYMFFSSFFSIFYHYILCKQNILKPFGWLTSCENNVKIQLKLQEKKLRETFFGVCVCAECMLCCCVVCLQHDFMVNSYHRPTKWSNKSWMHLGSFLKWSPKETNIYSNSSDVEHWNIEQWATGMTITTISRMQNERVREKEGKKLLFKSGLSQIANCRSQYIGIFDVIILWWCL